MRPARHRGVGRSNIVDAAWIASEKSVGVLGQPDACWILRCKRLADATAMGVVRCLSDSPEMRLNSNREPRQSHVYIQRPMFIRPHIIIYLLLLSLLLLNNAPLFCAITIPRTGRKRS